MIRVPGYSGYTIPMWGRPSILLALLVFPTFARAPDWSVVERETLDHFTALLRIDTTSPPGNEALAVAYLKNVLEREGIPFKEYEFSPGRANLVVRISGSGAKRPILVMAHPDVVGVQKERWSVDPFAALRREGYIYGRGALDDKDNLAAGLMLVLLLKRQNVKLDRDVIFLAEGDEESSGGGVRFMIDSHWQDIDAEYCIAEGGGGMQRDGVERYVTIATTEKVPRGVRLVARGVAGHGSTPRADNAVVRLAAAVDKVAAWQPPMRLNDTTRTYFEKLASVSPPEEASRYKGLVDPQKSAAIQDYFRKYELIHNSILRTSISPNIIRAGFRQNVIPSEAEAYLDIRALPDEDIPAFYRRLREIIADAAIEIAPNEFNDRPVAVPSRLDSAMYRAMESAARKVYPRAALLPAMLTGATDMAFLRAKGVQAYGVGPLIEEKDRNSGQAHGDDEKVLETSIHRFMRFLWHAVLEVAEAK